MTDRFIFKNFDVPDELEKYSSLVLERISDPFPNSQFLSARMIKMNTDYFCFISFLSGQREYSADATSLDPKNALDKLDENLSQQLVVEQADHYDPLIFTWNNGYISREL